MRFPFFRNRDSVKNGILISIRRTGDGFHPGLFSIGTKSIKMIVNKYDGEYKYEINNGKFITRILMPMNNFKLDGVD